MPPPPNPRVAVVSQGLDERIDGARVLEVAERSTAASRTATFSSFRR
jgi:hypothetical protein